MVRKNLHSLFSLGRKAAPLKTWTIGWSVAAANATAQRPLRETAPSDVVGIYGLLAGANRR